VTLFAWVILAGLVIAVAIAIDPIASISWSDPAPEVAVATTLSAGGADDEPGIVSIAGAATSGVTKASAAGAGSAGCMAGLRGPSLKKATPKKTTIVAAATAPTITRLTEIEIPPCAQRSSGDLPSVGNYRPQMRTLSTRLS